MFKAISLNLPRFCYRNIKDFMCQTGDPTGTGKGGNSIWGKKFDDEFHETLKVCVCVCVSVYKLEI